jgi:hypothetical protein
MSGTGRGQGRLVTIHPEGYEPCEARLHLNDPKIATDEDGNNFYQVFVKTLKGSKYQNGPLTWVDQETFNQLT